MGDISSQLAIREKLQCKPFKWFMEEIAFDLVGVRYSLGPQALGMISYEANINIKQLTR